MEEQQEALWTLMRADPRELLLLEAAGYTRGLRWLTVEYPDDVAESVVDAVLTLASMVEDIEVLQVPGRVLIGMRNPQPESVLADLTTRIRSLLPLDSSGDAIRDGAR